MEEVKTYRLVDNKRIDTGKTYIRNSLWGEEDSDCYIVGINNWIINSKGEFLVQRRALTKKNNPGKWSSTNGLIQINESNIEAVKRETKEELGINIKNNQIYLVEDNHFVCDHLLVDIFITISDFKLEDIKIQESEVDQIKYVTLDDLSTLDISTTCSYIKELAPKIHKMYSEQIKKIK